MNALFEMVDVVDAFEYLLVDDLDLGLAALLVVRGAVGRVVTVCRIHC